MWLPKPTKSLFWLTVRGRNARMNILRAPTEQNRDSWLPVGGKNTESAKNLGSERGGQHLRYITQPWFQDDLGVVGPEFQANRVDGKGPAGPEASIPLKETLFLDNMSAPWFILHGTCVAFSEMQIVLSHTKGHSPACRVASKQGRPGDLCMTPRICCLSVLAHGVPKVRQEALTGLTHC